MAAVAGVAIFNEAVTVPLLLGIGLTLLGLVLLAGRDPSETKTDELLPASTSTDAE